MKERRKLHSILVYYLAINVPFDPKGAEWWLKMICQRHNMVKNILITESYADSSKLSRWLKDFIRPVVYCPDDQHFRQNFDTGQYFHFRQVLSG